MKKILVIYNKQFSTYWSYHLNWRWIDECKEIFNISMWGLGYVPDCSQSAFNKMIDEFQPDFIYMSIHESLGNWLPDISYSKAKKIYVECDSQGVPRNHKIYDKYDEVYCRQPRWGKWCRQPIYGISRESYDRMLVNIETWEQTPLLRWSIPEKCIKENQQNSEGVFFTGRIDSIYYEYRRKLYEKYNGLIKFTNKKDSFLNEEDYWNLLYQIQSNLCMAESNIGSLVPGKVFEAATAGCAIITNCDLIDYEMPDLDKVVLHYKDETELIEIINSNVYKQYVNKTQKVIKNHTHKIRYQEIFK